MVDGMWIVLAAMIGIGAVAVLLRALPIRDRMRMLAILILGIAIGVGRYAIGAEA